MRMLAVLAIFASVWATTAIIAPHNALIAELPAVAAVA
jgi:hypothetical protein